MREIKKLTGSQVKKRLNTKYFGWVDLDDEISIMEVSPRSLLNRSRFDVVAKYIYAKLREMGVDTNWGKEIYTEHIRVWNNFYEPDESKSGLPAFLDLFDKLLDSIKNKGFDNTQSILPLGVENTISDGAHRLAACLLYDKDVSVAKIDNRISNYDFRHFHEKGLQSKYCDAIALEYCMLKPNTYIVLVYPSALGKDGEIEKILHEHGTIYYEKKVSIQGDGQLELIKQIYLGESWIGNWNNGFAGAKQMANLCFKGDGLLRVYVFETDSLEQALQTKQEIRNLFNIGKHSVHINNTQEETIRIAQILFNDNSIHFLNNIKVNEHHQQFRILFDQFKEMVNKQQVNKEAICICSSSVLGAYGMRTPNDFDYMIHGTPLTLENYKVKCSNSNLQFYAHTLGDIVFNPQCHFYYEGFKFASLKVVKEAKKILGTAKDAADILLIDSALVQETPNYVALTFDDGPSEKYTDQMIEIFEKYHVPATFFCVGEQVKAHPHVIRKLQEKGHEICNHTWNHQHIVYLTDDELRQQIDSTNTVIKEIIGKIPTLFRPPWGGVNKEKLDVIHESGMINVLWNSDAWDWDIDDPTPMHERLLPKILEKGNSIVLLHDGDKYGCGPRDKVIESLPIIIKELLARGYQFLTVSEFYKTAFQKELW
ncbi:polysaccharide deacetylase family protein [Neobacillus cucumis]|uniref:polysaccharide deacetylase family protein n=1 Tax=Neobacillus cucumis TaxID=1740721 RepID=UPI002E1FFFDE|nr:polysaccharide deacetylase family protein [Neobacillus cucumis]